MATPDRARVLHGAHGPQEVLGLMQHMDLAVGMRLHFLVFAALSGTPFLPLPYAGKVAEFARALGVETPASLDRDAVGPLLAALDRLWDERGEHAVRLRARLAELQPRSAAPLRHVLEVLAGASEPAVAGPPTGIRTRSPAAGVVLGVVGG
jgi:polysaccharide pyruvyl transferase WcaK-like protein